MSLPLLVLLGHVLKQHFDAFLQSSVIDAINHAGAIDDRKMLVSSNLLN